MEWLSDHSAAILVISAVASFFITGFLEFFHYWEVFGKALRPELSIAVSIMLSLFFQGIRCATIANSAKQFRQDQKLRGTFILLVSLAVTIFCAYEARQIASIWEMGHPEIQGFIHLAVLCVVWAGWVLELILVVSVSGEASPTQLAQVPRQVMPKGQPRQKSQLSNKDFELEPFMAGNSATS